MKRWTNGLPGATKRLGANLALRGLSVSQSGCSDGAPMTGFDPWIPFTAMRGSLIGKTPRGYMSGRTRIHRAPCPSLLSPPSGAAGHGRRHQQRTKPLHSGYQPGVITKLAGHRGASPMTIIDSQVHAYEANSPKRPWHSVPNWPDHVTGSMLPAAMDKVGVDGAIFISAFSLYRYDASYAVAVQRAHPGRFAIVKPVDPDDPDVADVVAEWKKTPGTV